MGITSYSNVEAGSRRLLVVDDDKVTRMTITKVLRKQGYEVIEAENGAEALERFAELRPDMVLLDVMMPVMDGYEACAELRKQGGYQRLPIMMLTGADEAEAIDKAFESGATDFITKPINWSLLGQRVRYALRTRELDIAFSRNQERLNQAQRIAKLGYWEMNLENGTVRLSDSMLAMMGGAEHGDYCTLNQCIAMVHADDRERVEDAIREALESGQPYSIDHRMLLPDGSELIVEQVGELELDEEGRPYQLMAVMQDITDRRRAEAMLEYQTFYDSLTDLPNRRLFQDHVQNAIAVSRQNGRLAAVLFVGLDRFKGINDSLGHAAGDEVLRQTAARLKAWSGEYTSVARFGADVFAVVLEQVTNLADVDTVASQLLTLFEEPMVIGSESYFITASIGICLFPLDCEDEQCLLQSADIAMFRAKEAGGKQAQYFTSGMGEEAQKRLALEREMRLGLERGDFELYYQPQVDVASRRIVSMEALVRWPHPIKGMVFPSDFIPVAEDSGLIVQLGEWVLREACRQTQEWNEHFDLNLRVGVNLSARQFGQPDLVGVVKSALSDTGLPADRLDLEVTESAVMDDMETCINTLHAFRALGAHCSMDDFGTGYSSLSYLQKMPINTLKIDMAFVRDIKDDGENGDIAKAIIALSHSLDLEVIAEGVETEGQYRFMSDHDCDIIQGYLISKPLPAADFAGLLEKETSGE